LKVSRSRSALVVINPQILVLHPSLPAHSVKELISLAKARPGQINYASVGPGSPNHLGMEMLKAMAGIDMLHVPYKGTAPRAHRPARGASIADVQQHALPVLPHVQGRKTQRHRSRQRQALAGGARYPDGGRIRRAGIRIRDVVRPVRTAATPRDIILKINAR